MDSQHGGQPDPAQTSLAVDFSPRSAGWYSAQQAYERHATNHAPGDIFQKQLQPHVDMDQRTPDLNLHTTDMQCTHHQMSGTIGTHSSSGSFTQMQLLNTVNINWRPAYTYSNPGRAHENYRFEVMDVDNTRTLNLALGFSDPTRGLSILGQQNREPGASTQPVSSMPAEPIPPSARPRKRKAPTLREDAFAPYKVRILQLHLDMGMTLPQVKKTMEEECGLKAELRQYRSQISRWGKDKNVKPREMRAIVRKRQKRKLIEPHKNELVFRVRGAQVPTRKIERWMKGQNLSDSLPYSPSPSAPTPSDVECRTISERGSPAPISIHSPMSSDIIPLLTPPRISSPASSIPSIFCPPSSVFTGKSPTLTYRPLANSYSGSYRMNRFNARPRYRQTDEEFLRNQIARASLSDRFGITESLELYLRLGQILIDQARYKSAHEIISKVSNSHRSWSGNDNEYTLNALRLLSITLRFQGSYTEAERVCRRALERCYKVLGQGHLCTLNIIMELGVTLVKQSRDEEAEAMHRRALKGAQEISVGMRPFLSEIMCHLAELTGYQDKYEEAEVLYREGIQELKRTFGRKDPRTLDAVQGFAVMRLNQGKHQEAEAIFQQVLSELVRMFGAEHIHTLGVRQSIVFVRLKQGKHQEAAAIIPQVVEGLSQALGEKHPTTLGAIDDLGCALQEQGRYEEAETMYRKALEGFIEVLGEKHLDTLQTFYKLGRVLRRQNRYEEAEGILRKALERYIEVFGEKHIDTLRAFYGLGQVFREQNRFEEAEAMFLKEQEGRLEVHGEKHIETLKVFGRLGQVFRAQNRFEEAEAMLLKELEGRLEVHGEKHIETLKVFGRLGQVFRAQNRFEEAEAMLLKELEGRREVLGARHPYTLATLDDLEYVLKSQGKNEEAEAIRRWLCEE